jgi:hypothetical protein
MAGRISYKSYDSGSIKALSPVCRFRPVDIIADRNDDATGFVLPIASESRSSAGPHGRPLVPSHVRRPEVASGCRSGRDGFGSSIPAGVAAPVGDGWQRGGRSQRLTRYELRCESWGG